MFGFKNKLYSTFKTTEQEKTTTTNNNQNKQINKKTTNRSKEVGLWQFQTDFTFSEGDSGEDLEKTFRATLLTS